MAYSQLCPLIGIVVVFGCSAPASMALLLVIVQFFFFALFAVFVVFRGCLGACCIRIDLGGYVREHIL